MAACSGSGCPSLLSIIARPPRGCVAGVVVGVRDAVGPAWAVPSANVARGVAAVAPLGSSSGVAGVWVVSSAWPVLFHSPGDCGQVAGPKDAAYPESPCGGVALSTILGWLRRRGHRLRERRRWRRRWYRCCRRRPCRGRLRIRRRHFSLVRRGARGRCVRADGVVAAGGSG